MDHKRVIDELIQGKEFAKQLRTHLNNSTSSTYEVQELLIHNILNSYDKSLSLLTSHGVNLNGSNNESHSHFGKRVRRMESQAPSSQSPHSEFSDHDHQSKDPSHEIFSSKRKSSDDSMQKLKNIKVKVSREMEFQEALDDGYGWTKYGQKDILGAKHPRGYYRCINRQTQGCLATKQVQRVDDATIIYDITYHGSHTCNPASSTPQLEIQKQQPSQQKKVLQSPENISVFKAENLESPLYHLPSTSTFNLPTSVNTINRPTTSRSTYFTMSQPRAGLGQKDDNPVVLETELDHIVSTATSFKCSLNDDAGFTFGELAGFGNDINFDDPAFF